MKITTLTIPLFSLLLIFGGIGCKPVVEPKENFDQVYQGFSMERFKQHVKILSADDFAGREPGTQGDKDTQAYMIKAFKSLGLVPGHHGSYLQQVDMLGIQTQVEQPLVLGEVALQYQTDYMVNSRLEQTKVKLEDSPLVFVGYGVNAPEYNWNDYQGIDVKGKTVVVLVNDPGYAAQNSDIFEAKTMTYYGRWPYKYEEAARQGAKGAIIIHQSGPAGYGWNVIASSWAGTQYHLPAQAAGPKVLDMEMWLSLKQSKNLFKAVGLDFEQQIQRAKTRGFKPVELGITATVTVSQQLEQSTTNNVIATLQGSQHPDEHIIYMGHTDHIGTNEQLTGDQIYNGAHDNATGIGGLIEIARAYSELNVRPARSITFVGAAAEEQGALGSKTFAAQPSMPLAKIVGLINLDSLNITGRKKDVTVVGMGKSELELVLAKAAARQNRYLAPEPHPERGYYYRSDHFSLAKKGVPALSVGGGSIPLNDVEAEIFERVGAIVSQCYHQPCDEYDEGWGWAGAIENLQLYFDTGYQLAIDDQWPNWYRGSEFRALRDQMRPKAE